MGKEIDGQRKVRATEGQFRSSEAELLKLVRGIWTIVPSQGQFCTTRDYKLVKTRVQRTR